MNFIDLIDDLERVATSLKGHTVTLNKSVEELRSTHPGPEEINVSETLNSFLMHTCELRANSVTPATTLHELFNQWCKKEAVENPYVTQRAFGHQVGKIFSRVKRNGRVFYKGLEILGRM